MQPKLLIAANHDTMLNLGCDCGMFFAQWLEVRIVKKKCCRPKILAPIKVWFVEGFVRCIENSIIVGWSIGSNWLDIPSIKHANWFMLLSKRNQQ